MALDPSSTEIAANLKGVELLFEYTKFHIGAYLTLASAFVAIASVKRGEEFALPLRRELVIFAMVFFMLAGLAGGVIVSTITQCYGVDAKIPMRCTSTQEFLKMPMGPWNGKIIFLSGEWWTYVEHTSFWIGLLLAVGSFLFPKPVKNGAPVKPPVSVQVQGSIRIDKDT